MGNFEDVSTRNHNEYPTQSLYLSFSHDYAVMFATKTIIMFNNSLQRKDALVVAMTKMINIRLNCRLFKMFGNPEILL